MFDFLKCKKKTMKKVYTEKEYESVLGDNANLRIAYNSLQAQKDELQSKCDAIISERDKLKTLVREQTAADLLINALKGLGIIPKPINYDAFSERNRLMAQQQQATSMNASYFNRYASALQGLGLFRG